MQIILFLICSNSVKTGNSLTIPIIATIWGVWLLYRGFVYLNRKRFIQNIPTSKIDSIAIGMVEIQGRSFPSTDKPLSSPYSKKDCVFYYFAVQEFKQTSRGGNTWHTISKGSSGVPFYVDDDSGRVLVDPMKAEIKLEPRYISCSPEERIPLPIILTPGTVRYVESFVIPGESVCVVGTAKEIKTEFEDYRKKVAQKLTEWYYNPEKQKEFDINQDGDIDEKEYASMKEKAEQFVIQEETKGETTKNDSEGLSNIIITKGEIEKLFVISNESEKTIVSQLGTKTVLYMLSGIIIILIALISMRPQNP